MGILIHNTDTLEEREISRISVRHTTEVHALVGVKAVSLLSAGASS